jgi:hypothetical protein
MFTLQTRTRQTRLASPCLQRKKKKPMTMISRASIFTDITEAIDRIVPKPISDARKQMEYFDGPGGMLAKFIPFNKKPTIDAPTVDAQKKVLFDFENIDEGEFKREFGALNDNVMGGRSDARVVLENGAAKLSGVTEDQFGGFASFKSRDFANAIDLSSFSGINIRCRGDGKAYKLIIYDTNDSFNVAFHKVFETKGGDDFEDIKLKFKDFKPVQRGRLVREEENEYRLCDGSKIMALQVMLSKFSYGMDDKNALYNPGKFSIEVARIEAFD